MRSGLWPQILRSTGFLTTRSWGPFRAIPTSLWWPVAFPHFQRIQIFVTLGSTSDCLSLRSRLPSPTQQVKPTSAASSSWVSWWNGLPTFVSAPFLFPLFQNSLLLFWCLLYIPNLMVISNGRISHPLYCQIWESFIHLSPHQFWNNNLNEQNQFLFSHTWHLPTKVS